MSRIKWRVSAATFGLPGRRRDFRVQYQANALRCQAITVSGRTMCRLWRQPATIARARSTRAGRSAGGADEATRSFGKRRVGDEARGSPPVVRHEFENWTLPERKGRRKESSSRYHQDLMNARNLCIFSSDGVFGNHKGVWEESPEKFCCDRWAYCMIFSGRGGNLVFVIRGEGRWS